MAIYVEKKYQKSSLPAIVEDSLESGSHENAPSINAVKKAIPNQNLLINSDFRNPINQRGKTSYPSQVGSWEKVYSIDRWYVQYGVTLAIANGYIVLANYNASAQAYFSQPFKNALPNSDYTVTIKCNNVNGEINCLGQILVNGVNIIKNKGGIDSLTIGLNEGASIDIEYIKLEKGDTATPFNPRLFDEELALCKRFYQKIPTDYLGLIMSMGSQTYRILSNYQGFRTNPTVKWINGTQIAVFNRTDKGNGFNITITNFTYNQEGMLIIVGTNGTSETIAPGIVGIALLSHAAVELDAEIY